LTEVAPSVLQQLSYNKKSRSVWIGFALIIPKILKKEKEKIDTALKTKNNLLARKH